MFSRFKFVGSTLPETPVPDIRFRSADDLESWKREFPDPTNSPARYAKTLYIGRPDLITAADAEAGSWISGFSRVVHLEVDSRNIWDAYVNESMISLVPFHGFSPLVKSLRVGFSVFPSPQIIDLTLSFPLIEDLSVSISPGTPGDDGGFDGLSNVVRLLSLPLFTGSLELRMEAVAPIASWLLSLPGGIHFRKLTLTWFYESDFTPSMALVEVEMCSHTLESLDITCGLNRTSVQNLHWHQQLIPLIRTRIGVEFGQPLESDETQRCKFSASVAERGTSHRDTPNYHARTPEHSTSLD